MTQHGLVCDAWEVAHPQGPIVGELTEQAQIDLLGVTCDCRLNSFRPWNLETIMDDAEAKRIDYVFTSRTVIEEAKVVLTERIPEHNINYSDHYGVSVTLQLPEEHESEEPTGYLSPDVFNSISEVTTSYVIRERKWSLYRIAHFYLSIAVCTSMLTAVWFVDQRGSIFVMMFFSTMCAWCGVVDGLIGVVWGRMELRALREFASEIDLARKFYAQEGLLEEI